MRGSVYFSVECWLSVSGRIRLWTNGDAIFDFGDTWRRPGNALGLLALDPGPHGTLKDDFATVGLDHDAIGVDFRIALERFLNLSLDVLRLCAGPELNLVAHAFDPFDPAYCFLRRLPLVLPLDLAFETHPAVLDNHLDVFR
jgi:hypothetical protein